MQAFPSVKHDAGYLLPLLAGTVLLFLLVAGATHDIAHDGGDHTLEYAVLVACLPGFLCVYGLVLVVLPGTSQRIWFLVTGLLFAFCDFLSILSFLHPKYPRDQWVASLFLIAGIPALGAIAWQLVWGLFGRRSAGKPESNPGRLPPPLS